MRLYALLLRLRLLAPVVSATSAPIVAITALASQSGCNRYVVKPQDTCWSVGQANNVTYAQLRSWNPEINLACSYVTRLPLAMLVAMMLTARYRCSCWLRNLQTLTSICVSNPFGNFAMSTNVVSTTIATTPACVSHTCSDCYDQCESSRDGCSF